MNHHEHFPKLEAAFASKPATAPSAADGDAARTDQWHRSGLNFAVQPCVLRVLSPALTSDLLIHFGNLARAVRRVEQEGIRDAWPDRRHELAGIDMKLCRRFRVQVVSDGAASAVPGERVNDDG